MSSTASGAGWGQVRAGRTGARRHGAAVLWLLAAALGVALSAAAALSALGPLLIGLHLLLSEARARRFLKVGRLQDLLAAEAPLGQVLHRLNAAESRVQQAGAQQRLARLSDGFYFEERDRRGRELNVSLAQLLVARRQLAYDFDLAVRQWTTALARRDVARLAALLFVGAVAFASFYKPAGLRALGSGMLQGGLFRLAGSAVALAGGFGLMRLISHAAAQAFLERLSQTAPAGSRRPHAAAV